MLTSSPSSLFLGLEGSVGGVEEEALLSLLLLPPTLLEDPSLSSWPALDESRLNTAVGGGGRQSNTS